ncbi:hypothetical protein KFE25_013296 [Diacronema lutheri]|uniref:Uncharacterized protein n=1 Tax=Diacronema lutheri TaxID=2081491 RepID=A0A8J5XIJ4_DIALT|nr:hypothetical protein KFE25_013296 [Diacronema lutheri]
MSAAIQPLISKIAEYRTTTFDATEGAARRMEIVELFQQVFVPALGFAFANVGVYLAVILCSFAALEVSGVGFEDVRAWLLQATGGSPWIVSSVGRLDPKLGNLAIALFAAELAGPLIIAASLALSSSATDAIRSFLASRGLDPRGASEMLERTLGNMKS